MRFHQLPFWDMDGLSVAICCLVCDSPAQVLILFMNFLVVRITFFLLLLWDAIIVHAKGPLAELVRWSE